MHDLTRNRPARISLLLGLFAVLGVATSAVAALINPAVQSFPTIFADNTGSLTYDGLNFIVDADPISMFDPAFGPPAFFTGGMATIDADVDGTGALVSGTFTLTGSVDPPNPAEPPVAGTLLTGTITAFGFQDTSPGAAPGTDTFDFVVTITGGTMASSYAGEDLYMRVDAENSTFADSFAGPFGSNPTKISMFGTPPTASCDLFIDKTCCIPTPPMPGVDVCDGKVTEAVFEVVGGDCSATTNTQEGKLKCTGVDPVTGAFDVVDITVTKDADKIAVNGNLGGTTGVPVGSQISITNPVDGNGELRAHTKLEIDGPGGTQNLEIHTSCSKALRCDDVFGSLKLVEITTTNGGTTVCTEPDPNGTQCVQQIAAPFSCQDKIASISFEWTGEACQSPLPNPQEGKAECSGDTAGAEPVSVIYTGGDSDKITVDPASDIDIGESFSVTATGRDDLKAETKFTVTDAGGVVQSVNMHTSCSKSISCGDEFGGFKITSILGKDGTTCDLAPPGPLFQNSCEVDLAPPTPHCTSKMLDLQLAYIGDELRAGLHCQQFPGWQWRPARASTIRAARSRHHDHQGRASKVMARPGWRDLGAGRYRRGRLLDQHLQGREPRPEGARVEHRVRRDRARAARSRSRSTPRARSRSTWATASAPSPSSASTGRTTASSASAGRSSTSTRSPTPTGHGRNDGGRGGRRLRHHRERGDGSRHGFGDVLRHEDLDRVGDQHRDAHGRGERRRLRPWTRTRWSRWRSPCLRRAPSTAPTPSPSTSCRCGGTASMILVVAHDGDVGRRSRSVDAPQGRADRHARCDVFTASGMGGSPNDQVWEVFAFRPLQCRGCEDRGVHLPHLLLRRQHERGRGLLDVRRATRRATTTRA